MLGDTAPVDTSTTMSGKLAYYRNLLSGDRIIGLPGWDMNQFILKKISLNTIVNG
jgi:hypothetical protein